MLENGLVEHKLNCAMGSQQPKKLGFWPSWECLCRWLVGSWEATWTFPVCSRGRNMTGTLLLTHPRCEIQFAEDHGASIWLWEPQRTLQGEKLCPQSFTCIITRMVNRLNIHCDALDFSNRFRRGREFKQHFTLICRWAKLRGKKVSKLFLRFQPVYWEIFHSSKLLLQHLSNKVNLLSWAVLYKAVCRWALHYRAASLIKVPSSSSHL